MPFPIGGPSESSLYL